MFFQRRLLISIVFVALFLIFTGIIVAVIRNLKYLKSINLENKKIREAEKTKNQRLRGIKLLLNKIVEKQIQIQFIESQIENLKPKYVLERTDLSNKLSNLKILTKEDWYSFKHLFSSAYPNFYSYLNNNFPDLTQAEIRQCCLIRLNLSNAQIASILGVSDVAVRQNNLRLRTKLGYSTQQALVEFLLSK